jgi:hypothetical protein
MTTITQVRMNVVLALAIPSAGLMYLMAGVALPSSRFTVGALVAFGVLWMTVAVALNTIRHPRWHAVGQEMARDIGPHQLLTPGYSTSVKDVSRPVRPWRWTSVLLAPVELLALAWSVPVLILFVMVPIGLALASVLWVGRLIVRL